MSPLCLLLLSCLAAVCSEHTFIGTNVGKQLLYHYDALYQARPFVRRVQNLSFRVPATPENFGKVIQGIMAYDLSNGTNSTARVTVGGVNAAYLNLKMKGLRGRDLHYDVYVYV